MRNLGVIWEEAVSSECCTADAAFSLHVTLRHAPSPNLPLSLR